MKIGTVVICSVPGSWSNYVGVVVSNDNGLRVSLNDRTVEVQPEQIISVVGITEASVQLAQDNGRWMRS